MCDCNKNETASGGGIGSQLGAGVNQAGGLDRAMQEKRAEKHASISARFTAEKRAVRSFQQEELRYKTADLRRFIRDLLPHEEGNIAQFKLDEAEMWAKKALEK